MAQKKTAKDDITKVGLAPLKGLNYSQDNNQMSPLVSELLRQRASHMDNMSAAPYFQGAGVYDEGLNAASMPSDTEGFAVPYGESVYDDNTLWGTAPETAQNYGDIRAERQPWYAKIAAGTGKAGVLAVTTALEGVGLLYGLGQGIYNAYNAEEGHGGEAFIHGLWDNPVTNTLKRLNDASEQLMPNYYSKDELENPMAWRNIFSANTLGDKLIKNTGFMIGAFYGGIPLSAGIGKLGVAAVKSARAASRTEQLGMAMKIKDLTAKAGGDVNKLNKMLQAEHLTEADKFKRMQDGLNRVTKMAKATRATSQTIGSLSSAINEGAIEAINNSNDWANLQKQKAQDDYQQKLAVIKKYYGGTEMEETMKVQAADDYQKTLEEIEKGKVRMGNADLLLNIPVLMASNMFQLGKLYARGFDSTRREMGNFFNGYKLRGNLAKGTLKTDKNWKKGVLSALAKSNTEGLEEYLQQAASDGAGQTVSESIDRFIRAGEGEESKNNVDDFIAGFGKAIADNLDDPSAWEQYMIGAVSSAFGMPVFGSQTKNAWLGKGAPVGLSGGLVGNYQDYMSEKEHEEQIANYLNGRVKDPKFKALYDNLRKKDDIDNLMQDTLSEDDKAKYKELEFENLYNDINAAASAGHLEEFKALVGYNQEYTEEELASIVETTTKTITAAEQKAEDEAQKAYIEQWLAKVRGNKNHSKDELKGIKKAEKDLKKVNKRLEEDNYKEKQEGPFINRSGQMNVQTDKNGVKGGEMIEILERNKKHLLDAIDTITRLRNDIDIETDGRLDDKQISLLTQMRAKIWNYDQRSAEMAYDLVTSLGDVKTTQKRWKDKIEKELKNTEKKYNKASDKHEKAKKTSKDEKNIAKLKDQRDKLKQSLEKARVAKASVDNIVRLFDMLTQEEDTTLLERRSIKEGYDSNDAPGVGRVNQWLGINDTRFDKRALYSEEVQAILSDSRVVSALISSILTDSHLNDNAKNRLYSELMDLHDLALQKIEYNKKIREYLDPDTINKAFQETQDKIIQEQKDNKAEELSLTMKNAKNMTDLDRIIREAQQVDRDIAKNALAKAKQSGDEDTKNFINDYEQGRNFFDSFSTQASSLPDDVRAGVLNTASSAWEYALGQGLDTYNTFIGSMRDAADALAKDYNPKSKETADSINQILSDLNAAKQATTTRSNPQKTVAKKGTEEKDNKEEKDTKPDDADKNASEALANLRRADEKSSKPSTPEIPTKDSLEKEIRTEVDDSYEDKVYRATKIEDLSKDLQDKINVFNNANPDDKIDDSFIGRIVGELVDGDIINGSVSEVKDVTGEESEESEKVGREIPKAQKMKDNLKTAFKSDHPTQYKLYLDYREPYDPEGKNARQLKAVQDLLEEYKAYQFVDKNYLGYIWQANTKKNKDTPVYFLKSTDNKVNTGSDSIIFMAIEWDSDAKKAVRNRAFNGTNANLSNEVKLVNINGKQYQIVGVLSIGTEVTQEVSEAFGKLQASLNAEFKEKKQSAPEGQPFVISDIHTNIDQVHTGRLEKANDENDEGDKVSLHDFMESNQGDESRRTSTEWKSGSKVYFKVVVNNFVMDATTIEEDIELKDPVTGWLDENNGAILMYIPKPDGILYPVRCTRRTVSQWMDAIVDGTHTGRELLDKAIENPNKTGYLDTIVLNLKVLFDPNADSKSRILAKKTLSRCFIFGKTSPIQYEGAEVHLNFPSITSNRKDRFDITADTLEGKIKQFFDILAENNVLFTIPHSENLDGRSIVESGVLEIGLRGFYNFNANFTVKPIDEKGKLVAIAPIDSNDSASSAPALGEGNPHKYDFDLGDGKKTYYIEEGKIYVDGELLEDTGKQNLVLCALEAEQGRAPLALYKIGLSNIADEKKKEIASKMKRFDNVYIISNNGEDWIYDARFANHDERLYKLSSDRGNLLKEAMQKELQRVLSTSNKDVLGGMHGFFENKKNDKKEEKGKGNEDKNKATENEKESPDETKANDSRHLAPAKGSTKPTEGISGNVNGRFAGKKLDELDTESDDDIIKALIKCHNKPYAKKIFKALQVAETVGNPIDDDKVMQVLDAYDNPDMSGEDRKQLLAVLLHELNCGKQ